VTKIYTRAEADEILRRALAEQADGGISHDDLVAAAREVGIPEAAIEAAASQLGEHVEIERRVGLLRQRKQRAFFRHVLTFVIVNAGVFMFDWLDAGAWFFQFPLLVWSVILMLFGVMQLAPNPEGLARRAERELEKERRRERWRRKLLPKSEQPRTTVREGAREFEAAVEHGVSELLSAAARALRGVGGPRMRVDTGETREDETQGPEQRARRTPRA
jgi:hypothetical protein